MHRFNAYIAEFIGVFCLCFVGTAAIVLHSDNLMIVALAHGFVVIAMATATMTISGAHLNPAVSLALLFTKRQHYKDTIAYIFAQCLGAVAGCGMLFLLFPAEKLITSVGMVGTPSIGTSFNEINALISETVATFFLVFVIWGTAVRKDGNLTIAPILFGLVVIFDIFAIGKISGAAMNPARWAGPAIIGGQFTHAWVYCLGPMVGAGLAALIWDKLLSEKSAK